jgi:hypothetical protein
MATDLYLKPLESGLMQDHAFTHIKGSNNYLTRVHTANSDNASQTVFRIDVGDDQLLMSRMLILECPVRLYRYNNNAGTAGTAFNNGDSAVYPRAHSLMRCCRSINVNLNGVSFQSFPSRDILQFAALNHSPDMDVLGSEYMFQPDVGSPLDATVRSFADYQGSAVGAGYAGGRDFPINYTGASSTMAELDSELGLDTTTIASRIRYRDYILRCPVFCPQILDYFHSDKSRTLPHVQTMEITFNWESNIVNHLFEGINVAAHTVQSYRAASKPAGVAWAAIANGGLSRLYSSTLRAPYKVSPSIILESNNIMSDRTIVSQNVTVAAPSVASVSSNRIVLTSIPEYILISVSKRLAGFDNISKADTNALITSLTVEYNGHQIQFDQYMLSRLRLENRLNGYKVKAQYQNYIGDIFCLRVGEHLPMNENDYVGKLDTSITMYTTLSYTAYVTPNAVSNTGVAAAAVTEYFEISTLAVSPALIELSPAACVYRLGLPSDPSMSNSDLKLVESEHQDAQVQGSGLNFNKLSKYGSKVLSGVTRGLQLVNDLSSKAQNIAGKVNQYSGMANDLAQSLQPKPMVGSSLVGGTILAGRF